MTVLAIVGEVSILQLLPSLVLLWKLKNGMQPLMSAILGIDSLLNICEYLHEVGIHSFITIIIIIIIIIVIITNPSILLCSFLII